MGVFFFLLRVMLFDGFKGKPKGTPKRAILGVSTLPWRSRKQLDKGFRGSKSRRILVMEPEDPWFFVTNSQTSEKMTWFLASPQIPC